MTQLSIISPKAQIGNNVIIGPFCVIGHDVIIEDNVELKSHVVIEGRVKIGSGTIIYPFASIGNTPQISNFGGEDSEVIIGKNNVIREYVTIQPGTKEGGMITSIGDNGLFMVGAHIAHDCKVGNNAIFANYVSLAGHVIVGDYVRIGGLSAVHQRVRIGSYAMVGGVSALVRDLVPYGLAVGDRAHLEGLNLIGMKRSGINNSISLEANQVIEELLSRNNNSNFNERLEKIANQYASNHIIMEIVNFLKDEDQSRNLCLFKKR